MFSDCPGVTSAGLGTLASLTRLKVITLSGGLPGLTDSRQGGPDDTGRRPLKLPPSLNELHLSGELPWNIHAIDVQGRTVVTADR